MNSAQLLKEYDLDLDDVRWFLSVRLAEELLGLYQEPRKLIQKIWSKQLEEELYDMEEAFLRDLDGQISQGTVDDIKLRQLFSEIKGARRRRGKLPPS